MNFEDLKQLEDWVENQLEHIEKEGYGFKAYLCNAGDDALFSEEEDIRRHIREEHDVEPVSQDETLEGWDDGEYKSKNYEELSLFSEDVVKGLTESVFSNTGDSNSN